MTAPSPSPSAPSASGPWRPSALERERRSYRRARSLRSAALAALSTVAVAALATTAVVNAPGWNRVRDSFFNLDVALRSLPDIATGLLLNLELFAAVAVSMTVVGLVVAVMRTVPGAVGWPLRALGAAYVDIFRGIPLLVLLFLVGFGVPGLRLQGTPSDATVLGGVALTLSYSAYVAEVLRAGIESVHPSQRAAARSLGLSSSQTMRLVVLPQAVRRVVPALLNDLVSLIKDSGLVSILGIPLDAIRYAQIWQAQEANYTPFVVAAVLFMLITIPATRLADLVTKKYGYTSLGGHL
jgi:polar amino acid transport system permease protein